MLHVLPKGFHRIRHYGLRATSRAKADTIARARKLIDRLCRHPHCGRRRRIRHPPAPTRRTSESIPAPCCGGRHGHHRDVRGRHDAATSSERDADRNPDRYIMMVVTTISHVTAAIEALVHARQRCRSARASINDTTKAERSPARSTYRCRSRPCSAARIIRGSAAHPTRCPPHPWRQPKML